MATKKFVPDNEVAYDKTPVQFKVLPGKREQLKAVPNWQDLLREYVDYLIATQTGSDG